MQCGTKSEILDCIAPTEIHTRVKPNTTAVILEGSVLVRQIRPGYAVTTMCDYADKNFLPHVQGWFDSHLRVDVVFDTYKLGSIKGATLEMRGTWM